MHLQYQLQEHVTKGIAGVGRALNSRKWKVGGPDDPLRMSGYTQFDESLKAEFYKATGKDAKKFTEALIKLDAESNGNRRAFHHFARQWHGVQVISRLETLVKSSIISGAETLRGNVYGTASVVLKDMVELEAGLAMQALQTADKELLKQIWILQKTYVKGFFQTFKGIGFKGWAKFAKLLKEGWTETDDGIRGALAFAQKEIQKDTDLGNFTKTLLSGESQLDPYVKFEHGPGIPNMKYLPLGDILTLPFRLLAATDEPFQHTVYQAYKRAAALDVAMKKGLRGDALREQVETWVKQEPEWLLDRAFKQSRVMTFKQPLEGRMQKFHDLLNGDRASNIWTKSLFGAARMLFIPFDKVVMNVGRTMAENTLLGAFGKRFRADWAAGGFRRKQAMLRITSGTAMVLMGWDMYNEGKLRGAIPMHMKGAADASNMQEYSYFDEENRQWVSIRRAEPIAKLFTIGAELGAFMDCVDAYRNGNIEKGEELFYNAIGIMGEAMSTFVGMEGMKQAVDLMMGERTGTSAGKWGAQQLGKLMPFGALAKDVNNYVFDEEMKKLTSLSEGWEAVRQALFDQFEPWKRDGLLPMRDPLYGHVRRSEDDITAVFPRRRTMTEDPATLELLDIKHDLKPMSDRIHQNGEFVRMNAVQYDRAQENLSRVTVGEWTGLQEILNGVIQDPRWGEINDAKTKREILGSIISEVRRAAKLMTLEEDESLLEQLDAKFQLRIDAMLGMRSDTDPRSLIYHMRTLKETDPSDLIGPVEPEE